LATKKTKVLKEHYKVLCKPLAASISTQALKNKRHTCYILSSKTIRSDGNKRIGAFLFIWFLDKNKHRFKKAAN
jgi:hypothetical protein